MWTIVPVSSELGLELELELVSVPVSELVSESELVSASVLE